MMGWKLTALALAAALTTSDAFARFGLLGRRTQLRATDDGAENGDTVARFQAMVKEGLAEINNIPEEEVEAFYKKAKKDNDDLVAKRAAAGESNLDEQVENVKDMLMNWAPDEIFDSLDLK